MSYGARVVVPLSPREQHGHIHFLQSQLERRLNKEFKVGREKNRLIDEF